MIVHACLRNGHGGSPTAVLSDGDFSDSERRARPEFYGTSHAVFIGSGGALRFFTPAGRAARLRAGGRYAARMFAPSIGVPEDIANANSTACLAAHLAAGVAVDMGDSLGRPATITATQVADGKPVRTRPLCPYPQVARYSGSGSPDDAASFACKAAE